MSLAQFLDSAPQDGYSAVFLINPQDSTPETLRVAWPETCLACGHWFDFPASVVESVVPLGVEECCASPIPKVALRIKPQHDSIIDMLRSHLAGTLGSETGAQPVQTRGMRGVSFAEEEMCGSEAEAAGVSTRGIADDVAAAAADAAANLELSGAHWVQRFPGSRSIFDTKPPFLDKISKFHQALLEAGAQVAINATLRPPERAYLMHFCVKISKGEIDPRKVPPMAGVGIQWFHGDIARSKQAAQQMAEAYNIAFPPALNSRHTQGLAIDMTITWAGTLNIKDATGATRAIGAPRTGHENTALHRVGATYGVVKLVSDRPHWSSDGH
jgi:D-alanyl-D-alanine dipeptidase